MLALISDEWFRCIFVLGLFFSLFGAVINWMCFYENYKELRKIKYCSIHLFYLLSCIVLAVYCAVKLWQLWNT